MIAKIIAIVIILVTITSPSALATTPSNLTLSSSQLEVIQQIRCGWETTEKLLSENFISQSEAINIRANYVTKLKSINADLDDSAIDLETIIAYQRKVNSRKFSRAISF